MTRLVQIQNGSTRGVALVEEPRLRLLEGVKSVFQLAREAVDSTISLTELIRKKATGEFLEYDAIYHGESEWKLRSPIDHPIEPARCLVSGTGLTHLGSAKNRQQMHSAPWHPRRMPSCSQSRATRWFRRGCKPGGSPSPLSPRTDRCSKCLPGGPESQPSSQWTLDVPYPARREDDEAEASRR